MSILFSRFTMSSISCNSITAHTFLVDCIPCILLSAELMQVCGNTWVGQLGGLVSAASIVVAVSVINSIHILVCVQLHFLYTHRCAGGSSGLCVSNLKVIFLQADVTVVGRIQTLFRHILITPWYSQRFGGTLMCYVDVEMPSVSMAAHIALHYLASIVASNVAKWLKYMADSF